MEFHGNSALIETRTGTELNWLGVCFRAWLPQSGTLCQQIFIGTRLLN